MRGRKKICLIYKNQHLSSKKKRKIDVGGGGGKTRTSVMLYKKEEKRGASRKEGEVASQDSRMEKITAVLFSTARGENLS